MRNGLMCGQTALNCSLGEPEPWNNQIAKRAESIFLLAFAILVFSFALSDKSFVIVSLLRIILFLYVSIKLKICHLVKKMNAAAFYNGILLRVTISGFYLSADKDHSHSYCTHGNDRFDPAHASLNAGSGQSFLQYP